ncbi:MAG: hypothetical protein AAF558_09870 [Verrucomicrobiota bacterium]
MKGFSIVFLLLILFAGGYWGYLQHEKKQTNDKYAALVAPLIAYREIYEEGRDREANDVLLMSVAMLIRAEEEGADLKEVFRMVEWINQTPVNYSDLLTEALLRNLKIARELGLDSAENLTRMEEGKSPVVQLGLTQERKRKWIKLCHGHLRRTSIIYSSISN